MNFENKIYEGIHYSRFIASWLQSGGTDMIVRPRNYGLRLWLNSLIINDKPIPEEVVEEIMDLANNGKLELECNAKAFQKFYKEHGMEETEKYIGEIDTKRIHIFAK